MHEIEEIMSPNVVSVTPETALSEVIELLVENDITGVPVVDADGQLIGVVTEKDVMGVLTGPGTAAGQVRDYMTKNVISFDINDDVIAICECLVNNHLRRVPILDGPRLVGIISRRDLIKYIIEPIHS